MAPQIAADLLRSGELRFDQMGGAVSLYNGANEHSHRAAWPGMRRQLPTSRACLQELTTHSRNRVGMAGFEPAASCSQISLAQALVVAGHRLISHLAAKTLSECRRM
jgi:hypothetical protein